MIELIYIPILTAINWLRGWGPQDKFRANLKKPPKWATALNYVFSDVAVSIYLILAFLPVVSWWQATLIGVLYYLAEFGYERRMIFACWNGKLNHFKHAPWYKLIHYPLKPVYKLAGEPENSRLFAVIYTCGAGIYYSLSLMPLGLSWWLMLPLTFGVCYGAMNILGESKHKYGETVGRGLYGFVLGIAAALCL